jgi:hypothetical protein
LDANDSTRSLLVSPDTLGVFAAQVMEGLIMFTHWGSYLKSCEFLESFPVNVQPKLAGEITCVLIKHVNERYNCLMKCYNLRDAYNKIAPVVQAKQM